MAESIAGTTASQEITDKRPDGRGDRLETKMPRSFLRGVYFLPACQLQARRRVTRRPKIKAPKLISAPSVGSGTT